jgi:hypothetical protein
VAEQAADRGEGIEIRIAGMGREGGNATEHRWVVVPPAQRFDKAVEVVRGEGLVAAVQGEIDRIDAWGKEAVRTSRTLMDASGKGGRRFRIAEDMFIHPCRLFDNMVDSLALQLRSALFI